MATKQKSRKKADSGQKPTIFDILKDVSHEKKRILNDDNMKEYNPFMVNRFLSMDKTTIFFAEWMNERPNIPRHLQYEFYMDALPPAKRFFAYKKGVAAGEGIEKIADYYRCTIEVAQQYEKLLTDEQKAHIMRFYREGLGGTAK